VTVANVFDPSFDEGEPGEPRRARLGWQAGSERLGISLYELPPAQRGIPYHYQHANEELLIVLAGRPHLRTPSGSRQLNPGEVASFPRGESGAHKLENRTDEAVRYLMLSEMNAPDVMVYPDSGKVGMISRPPGSRRDEDELAAWFRLSDHVDYWEGEPPPDRGDGGG
jgi:uncharacterized cupin superfamily protein